MPRMDMGFVASEQWKRRVQKELMARLTWPQKYGYLAKKGTRYEVMSRNLHHVPSMEELEKRLIKVNESLATVREDINIYDLVKPPGTTPVVLTKKPFPSPEPRPTLPVDPCVREYMEDNYGRELYLKLRNEFVEPDERYEFPQTESHMIGWRIREYEDGKHKSQFASKDCTQEVFRDRGVFPKDTPPQLRRGSNEELQNAQKALILIT